MDNTISAKYAFASVFYYSVPEIKKYLEQEKGLKNPVVWYDMELDMTVVSPFNTPESITEAIFFLNDKFSRPAIAGLEHSVIFKPCKNNDVYYVYAGDATSDLFDRIRAGEVSLDKPTDNPIYKNQNILNCTNLGNGFLPLDMMILNNLPIAKITAALKEGGLNPNLYNGMGDTALHTLAKYSVANSFIDDNYFKAVYTTLRQVGNAERNLRSLFRGETVTDVLVKQSNVKMLDFVHNFEVMHGNIPTLVSSQSNQAKR